MMSLDDDCFRGYMNCGNPEIMMICIMQQRKKFCLISNRRKTSLLEWKV